MSAKLVVHKFEKGENFKSLNIAITQTDNGSIQTTFGSWEEGKVEVKSKNPERSRLVVTVIPDVMFNSLDLDSCACETRDMTPFIKAYKRPNTKDTFADANDVSGKKNNDKNNENLIQHNITKNKDLSPRDVYQKQLDFLNPLEYSIKKVKENNDRIMENIHMLNRTLNYTKKKEILEMINPKPLHSYPCNECGKCFVYETGLRRHFFIRHGNIDTQQRWQTVWTCAGCFQVWPSKEVALKHSNRCFHLSNTKLLRDIKSAFARCEFCEDTKREDLLYSCRCYQNESCNFIREIKTSLLLQCEFCDKVFTSIPRLLQHSRTHTVESNYECSSCRLAFASYKNAEQHWLVCPWLLLSYKFSLPKMLLCNACDRKFRTYDHLYNHRYKAGHFLGKTYEDRNSNNVTKLVYQCEVCSQWFLDTGNLESHRDRYHPPNINIEILSKCESSTISGTY